MLIFNQSESRTQSLSVGIFSSLLLRGSVWEKHKLQPCLNTHPRLVFIFYRRMWSPRWRDPWPRLKLVLQLIEDSLAARHKASASASFRLLGDDRERGTHRQAGRQAYRRKVKQYRIPITPHHIFSSSLRQTIDAQVPRIPVFLQPQHIFCRLQEAEHNNIFFHLSHAVFLIRDSGVYIAVAAIAHGGVLCVCVGGRHQQHAKINALEVRGQQSRSVHIHRLAASVQEPPAPACFRKTGLLCLYPGGISAVIPNNNFPFQINS